MAPNETINPPSWAPLVEHGASKAIITRHITLKT